MQYSIPQKRGQCYVLNCACGSCLGVPLRQYMPCMDKIDARTVNPTRASRDVHNAYMHVTSCTKVCGNYVIPARLVEQGDRSIQDARNTLQPR